MLFFIVFLVFVHLCLVIMPNITTQQLESILEDKLKNALAPLSKSIEETKTSVAFISNKYDELLAKMTKYDQEKKDLVIGNTSLRAELLDSSKQIKMPKDSINSLEQYTRRDCVEIRGIPYVEGENTNNIVVKLGEKIGVKLNKDDISTRENFYRARKLLKDMTTRDLGYSGENIIFVNASLTQKNKDLFNECLKIKKDKGFRFLWTYAGKIFMRRNENSQVIHVTDASILQKIDQ